MVETRMQPKYVDGKSIHPGFKGYKFTEGAAKGMKEMFSRAESSGTSCYGIAFGGCYGESSVNEVRTDMAGLVKLYVAFKGIVRFDSNASDKIISDDSVSRVTELLDRVNDRDSYYVFTVKYAFAILHRDFFDYLTTQNKLESSPLFNH